MALRISASSGVFTGLFDGPTEHVRRRNVTERGEGVRIRRSWLAFLWEDELLHLRVGLVIRRIMRGVEHLVVVRLCFPSFQAVVAVGTITALIADGLRACGMMYRANGGIVVRRV